MPPSSGPQRVSHMKLVYYILTKDRRHNWDVTVSSHSLGVEECKKLAKSYFFLLLTIVDYCRDHKSPPEESIPYPPTLSL